MHNGTLKRLFLALTFWLALHTASLRAQIFTAPLQASTTGTNPVDFEFRADGTLIAEGNYGVGSLLSTDQGAGTRMLWYPAKAAFRAGRAAGTEWDANNIGHYSTAFGYNSTASGDYSVTLGLSSVASGKYSMAAGLGSTASGDNSVALGGGGTASGHYSTSLGSGNTSSGDYSTAMGVYTTASGFLSMTWGENAVASNSLSTSFGLFTTASGYYSTASGAYTTAQAYGSFVVGVENVGGGNATQWIAEDPLFEIGNGRTPNMNNNHPLLSDALLVRKNGTADFQGKVTAPGFVTTAPGGDIPMYNPNGN